MCLEKGWESVAACDCVACERLKEIRRRCEDLGGWLFVSDCRMYGRGYKVVDIRKLFIEPASEGPDFPDEYTAAEYVLARQKHCDVYLSSWPRTPAYKGDYAWSRLEIA